VLSNSSTPRRIWVGGYTPEMEGSAAGIGLLAVAEGGALTYRGTAASTLSPSFLGYSNGVIYATGESTPSVSAFVRDGDELTPLGEVPAAGDGPCALEAVGSFVIVASYGDGAVAVHRVEKSGAVGPAEQVLRTSGSGPHRVQDGPHAHDVLHIPGGRTADGPVADHVLTTDLGTDSVFVHELHAPHNPDPSPESPADRAASPLTRTGVVHLAPGTGPRDLLLRPSGDVWVLGEISCEIVVLRPQNDAYVVVATVPLAGARSGDHASAIAVNAAGTHAYVGLRGSNLISILATAHLAIADPAVDGLAGDGGLVDVEAAPSPVTSVPCGGDWPRHLVAVNDHLYVANQLSSTVDAFAIGADGSLTPSGSVEVPSPTYLLVD
jgi:6-phosphogluconolactonase